ncbi:MAG: hypothetical protein JWM27_3311 [Gemmatimonadetes bacterium]|nr:hypothetical protein [Gemmatimonadota bacterium]
MSCSSCAERARERRPSTPVLRRSPAAGGRCACGGAIGADGMCDRCRQRALQRQAAGAGPAVAPPIVHDVLSSGGRPLDAGARASMEPRFGHSFAGVRVHDDARAARSAAAVGANAYTVGSQVVFGAGRYAPGTPGGDRLLAHELAHVVQQGGAPAALQRSLAVGGAHDPAEREADRAAGDATAGRRPSVELRFAAPSLARDDAGTADAGVVDASTASGGVGGGGGAPVAASTGKTYPFKIKLNGCAAAPFDEAAVRTAARAAYDKVLGSTCVHSDSLRDEILNEFNDLDIDCEQGDKDSPCGMAHRYFTETINIYPKAMAPASCGPLESTILHEVVHLTEWRLFGHGILADACEASCFGYGKGDASKCK